MKRIVLTGGGTAGHVTPHLALLPHLLREGYEVHYIGTENGIERGMIEKLEGVTYHAVKSGKLRRYFDWKNFTDPFRVIAGAFQAGRLMGRLKPDVCFSKGGFVSVPVVIGAWLHRVPVVCHESDLTPGLANKICSKFARRVATTFPECAEALGKKAVCTGTPMRPALFSGSREKGLALAGFSGDRPVLMMVGGSSGAQSVNKALREALPKLLEKMDVLHLTGKGNLDGSLAALPGYKQFEFLSDELPDAIACADLILSRAGSNAICEFQALKKPMLLVPYPKGASRGDQILNAESFRKRGLCHVLLQENMTADSLYDAVLELQRDRESLIRALKNAPPADGTDAVLGLIHEIEKK
ncbi:MAG: undecaprenyldiphospho-muramoylpentapeptide beta-N-acetylglucosaminyltransferase [Clostridiales bacterium]|nr:undecaprenyldiphospho-muramoylpentapeptide beta-N-acetylglucosaminyltransferase [Clostridiales bacterium]